MGDLLRRYPEALIVAILGHVLIVSFLVLGADIGRDPTQAETDVAEAGETLEAVTVEPEAVDEALRRLEEQEQAEEAALREERERMEQERREEEQRLAELREQQEAMEQELEQVTQEELEEARQEAERLRQQAQEEAEQARQEAQQEAEQARQEAERIRREAEEAAEQARREAEEAAERARQEAEEAERRAEEERRRREEEERRQAELEAEEEARREAEEAAQAAAEREARERELERMGARYKDAIRSHVTQNWRQPSAFEEGNRALVRVRQIPSGDVTDVMLLECDGDRSFCESVEAAVRRASPLPEAPDPDVFERTIDFNFDPGGT